MCGGKVAPAPRASTSGGASSVCMSDGPPSDARRPGLGAGPRASAERRRSAIGWQPLEASALLAAAAGSGPAVSRESSATAQLGPGAGAVRLGVSNGSRDALQLHGSSSGGSGAGGGAGAGHSPVKRRPSVPNMWFMNATAQAQALRVAGEADGNLSSPATVILPFGVEDTLRSPQPRKGKSFTARWAPAPLDQSGADGSLRDAGDSIRTGVTSTSDALALFGRQRPSLMEPASTPIIPLSGCSLWLFEVDDPRRLRAYALVTHAAFEMTLYFVTLLNCVALACNNARLEPWGTEWQALYYANIGFTILYTLELGLKVVAYGFWPYVEYAYNVLDVVVVVTSIIDVCAGNAKWAQYLSALRPLRLLTHSADMRQVFHAIVVSLSYMGSVTTICLLFFCIFAILGVQLFAGRFWSCNDLSVANRGQCVDDYLVDGLLVERAWTRLYPCFDTFPDALLVLFITCSLNGYTQYMIAAMSAPKVVNDQPQLNSNWGAFFYFAAFVLVCALILINLYTGVIFSQFTRLSEQAQGSAYLSQQQQEWSQLQLAVYRLKPRLEMHVPRDRLRNAANKLVTHRYFEYFIYFVTLLTCLTLAASHYSASSAFIRFQHTATTAFTAIYAVEAVLKMLGLGWLHYWRSSWNKFDFLIVVLALVQLAVDFFRPVVFLRVLDIFRIEKLLRINQMQRALDKWRVIRTLYVTLHVSVPAFVNIGGLIFLFFYIYAYVGVLMFGTVQLGWGLNQHANFQNWPNAFLVLLRMATGDNWSDVMLDTLPPPYRPAGSPHCNPALGPCGTWLIVPYSVTFIIFTSYILLNLFMAVICEAYEKQYEMAEWILAPQMLDELVWVWAEFDNGTGTIDPIHMLEVVRRLDPPLGLGDCATEDEVDAFVVDLQIPLVNGRLPFHRTAYELVHRCHKETELPECAVKSKLDRLYRQFFRHQKAASADLSLIFREGGRLGSITGYGYGGGSVNSYAAGSIAAYGRSSMVGDSLRPDGIRSGSQIDVTFRHSTSVLLQQQQQQQRQPQQTTAAAAADPDIGAAGRRSLGAGAAEGGRGAGGAGGAAGDAGREALVGALPPPPPMAERSSGATLCSASSQSPLLAAQTPWGNSIRGGPG